MYTGQYELVLILEWFLLLDSLCVCVCVGCTCITCNYIIKGVMNGLCVIVFVCFDMFWFH